MKKKLFFLPALAALFFASCSSDEPETPTTGEEETGRFLAVNIISNGGSGSRAFADGKFEDGTYEENKATSALFVFYDENGNMTQTPQYVSLKDDKTDSEWKPATGSPESSKVATIVAIAGQKEPTDMLVIINPTPEIRSTINGRTLGQAKLMADRYLTSDKRPSSFIMTNSSYYNNGIVMETEIEKGQIKNSPEEAEASAVNVYVERIMAKVKVRVGETWKVNSENITVGLDTDIPLTLKPDVQGVEIANIAATGRLFKDITPIETWIAKWNKVNDEANCRSYWATTDVTSFNNKSWNGITDQLNTNPSYYVLPNTSTDQRTSVLVKAVLKDDKGEAVSLVMWGGNYYRKENFKNQIALFLNNEGYKVVTVNADNKNEFKDFEASDVDYISPAKHVQLTAGNNPKLKAYQSMGCVKAGLKVAKNIQEDGTYTAVNETELENYLSAKHHIFDLWEGGRAYYYTAIEHNPDVEDFKYGVIRNHVYDLELTSLSGLGVPVVDPDKIIIPENPEDKLFYVGAKVRILKWRVVPAQKVEFGK